MNQDNILMFVSHLINIVCATIYRLGYNAGYRDAMRTTKK